MENASINEAYNTEIQSELLKKHARLELYIHNNSGHPTKLRMPEILFPNPKTLFSTEQYHTMISSIRSMNN